MAWLASALDLGCGRAEAVAKVFSVLKLWSEVAEQ